MAFATTRGQVSGWCSGGMGPPDGREAQRTETVAPDTTRVRIPKGHLGLAVLAMALSFAVSSDAGAVTRVGPVVGVGEQKPAMFQSKRWKALDLRLARYIAPWDAIEDPQQLALLDAWMASARRA